MKKLEILSLLQIKMRYTGLFFYFHNKLQISDLTCTHNFPAHWGNYEFLKGERMKSKWKTGSKGLSERTAE